MSAELTRLLGEMIIEIGPVSRSESGYDQLPLVVGRERYGVVISGRKMLIGLDDDQHFSDLPGRIIQDILLSKTRRKLVFVLDDSYFEVVVKSELKILLSL